MGGIVIDIWEKVKFFGSFGSQKGAKNVIFVQGSFKRTHPYSWAKALKKFPVLVIWKLIIVSTHSLRDS